MWVVHKEKSIAVALEAKCELLTQFFSIVYYLSNKPVHDFSMDIHITHIRSANSLLLISRKDLGVLDPNKRCGPDGIPNYL